MVFSFSTLCSSLSAADTLKVRVTYRRSSQSFKTRSHFPFSSFKCNISKFLGLPAGNLNRESAMLPLFCCCFLSIDHVSLEWGHPSKLLRPSCHPNTHLVILRECVCVEEGKGMLLMFTGFCRIVTTAFFVVKFHGSNLRDQDTFAAVGVRDGDEIEVVVNPRSGLTASEREAKVPRC